MYERIMVPLDGSNASERALPYVEEMATKFNPEIALVSVAERAPAESDHLYRAYLKTIQEKVRAELSEWGARPGTRVDVEVLVGKPAEEILTYAAGKNVSLVVMASRGRSGEGPWLLGNIAAKVLRATTKPVLLARKEAPAERVQRRSLFQRIQVPLDGSKVAEQIIPHAEAMAKSLGGELLLLQAVELMRATYNPEASIISKSTIAKENKRRKESSERYLDGVAKGLRKRGHSVSRHVTTGAPAAQILDFAEANPVDLIAMSTHGRSGVGRWVLGSVTDKILHAGDMPVLVARAAGRTKTLGFPY